MMRGHGKKTYVHELIENGNGGEETDLFNKSHFGLRNYFLVSQFVVFSYTVV